MLLSLSLAAALAQTTHNVTVGGAQNRFSPKDIVIQVGDTVTWTWSAGIHNVNSQDGYFFSGAPVGPPMSFSLVFDEAFLIGAPISGNRYDYQCDLHAVLGMVGSVTVTVPGRPVLTTNDPAPGGTAQFTITGATPGGVVILGYSSAGAGPIVTGFGTASLSPPISQLPPVNANGMGTASISLPIPPSIPPGFTVWTQALDLSAGLLTNGARVIV
jgi:plastocyanin